MKIVGAKIGPISLDLIESLETAHGRIEKRSGSIVSLSSQSGATGWGEALPLPGFGLESDEASARAIANAVEALVGFDFRDLDAALDAVSHETKGSPAAGAALDSALHDLAARAAGVDLAAILDPTRRSRVPVSALIGGSDADSVARATVEVLRSGFGTIKLKVGAGGFEDDLRRVSAARSAAGPIPRIRLDANGAWSEEEALGALRELAAHDIEFIEQPVSADESDALARLRSASPIRIAADECVRSENDATHLLEIGAADVLILKPAAVGGIRSAMRIAERAQRAGVDVVVTSFLDSSLGIAGALHVASALPESPFAAGLASAGWLRNDLCSPLIPANGCIELPTEHGLGIRPDAFRLRRCLRGAVQEYTP